MRIMQNVLAALAGLALTGNCGFTMAAEPAGTAVPAESAQQKITRAMSAAPASISAEATIMDSDGTILRQGSNGWTCLPDTMPGDRSPMCNDAEWMELLQALGSKAEFAADRIGVSYMLQGEAPGAGVSNSNPFHAHHTEAEDYVESGPHLMILVPPEMLKGVNRDPATGGPFVMWGDTPYAHIMVPLEDENRSAPPGP